MEGIITDARHAVRDCYAHKPSATLEGRRADARHAVRDCYARKTAAFIEGILINFSYIRR